MLGSVFSPNGSPLANALEVFKGYRSIRVFGFKDKLFADSMIYVTLITGLLAAQFFESSLSGWRTDLLQDTSAVFIPLAVLLYSFTTVGLTIRVCCNIDDTEVNTNSVVNLLWCRLRNLTDSKQVEITFAIHQIGLALSRFQHLLLSLAANVRNLLATTYGPDTNELLFGSPPQNPVIKSDCPKWLESSLCLFVQLVGIRDFSDAPDYNLSRKAELLSDLRVVGFVDCILPEGLRFPRKLADGIASDVGLLKRLLKKFRLLLTRIQLYLRYQFHEHSISYLQVLKQSSYHPPRRFPLLQLQVSMLAPMSTGPDSLG